MTTVTHAHANIAPGVALVFPLFVLTSPVVVHHNREVHALKTDDVQESVLRRHFVVHSMYV